VPALDVLGAAKKTHAAAVSFEEATPGAVAAADGAAPEEVHAKKRGRDGLLMAPAEATREEKKAKRSAKKKARNAKRKKLRSDARVVARVDPGMGNPYEKEKLRKALSGDGAPAAAVDARGGDYGKSSKFFEQLQRDVSAAVRGGRADYAAPEPPKRKRAKRADAAKLG
jgi:U3 small nucleolar RNA-associated protein MPP10